MPEHGGFNPRYSPEFQRGYEPSTPRPPHGRADADSAPAGASPTQRSAPEGTGAEAAGIARAATASAATARAATDSNRVDDAGAETSAAGTALADVGDRPQASATRSRPSLWRNPYLIVLLVAGVLLILGGVQLYFRSIESMYVSRESTPQDMVAVQVFWGMAPVLMTAGAFTLIGVGFFAAYRWRQGRP